MSNEWTINDLNDKYFDIPSYQRGYKWTSEMVQDLLDDISENQSHCLQSLTIKGTARNNEWEVIDGQQRLTTIFILQAALKNERFSLHYNTRETSREFVNNEIDTGRIFDKNNNYDQVSSKNQDIYYFCQAAITISNWLQDPKNNRNRAALINNLHSAYFLINITKEKSETVFANLNSGRVLLTPIELLKADILINITQNEVNKTLGKSENDKISRQVAINEMRTKYGWIWDEMELWLSLPEVLNWISPKDDQSNHPTNKLKLLFDLFLFPREKETLHKAYCRQKEESRLRDEALSYDDVLWHKICNAFDTIKDWYLDNELYHWIGFLITSVPEEDRFTRLKNLYCETYEKSTGRQGFKESLKEKALEVIVGKKEDNLAKVFEKLSYGDDNKRKINNCLLFLNCLEIAGENLQADGSQNFNRGWRYRFDLHNSEHWSLEHILPQNPKTKDINKDYLDEIKDYFDNPEVKDDNPEVKIDNQLKTEFNKIYDTLPKDKVNIPDEQKEKIKKIIQKLSLHGMNNMALLSREVNSMLGNGLFNDKRNKIFKLISRGAFIPPLTSKVFSKTFPGAKTTSLYWTPHDTRSYEAYQQFLLNLFSKQAVKNESTS